MKQGPNERRNTYDEQQQNQQHVSNTAGNQGAQGIFYGDVHIHISPSPVIPGNPHTRASQERQAQVELFSKGETITTATAPRSVDWSHLFVWNRGPTEENVWSTVVGPDLAQLRKELGTHRVQRVLLYPRLHNGLGFGIGYTFVYAMPLTVEQPFPGAPTQMWAADLPTTNTAQLDIEQEKGPNPTGAILAEVSMSRNISDSVETYLSHAQLPPLRRRVRITPPGGASRDSVSDNAHAVAFAKQIGKTLSNLRDQASGATIHLFAALPLGLEILIGLHLNACEPIQIYGYDNAQSTYYPFYELG